VPTYVQIGIWGAVILTVLRFIQGVGVGGEWGGSVLLSMEWARTSAHRGFIAAWPQFGVPSGLFLANLAALAFSAIAGDQFLTWGWRIPFFLSIVLVGIGLYIRLGILETPIFARLAAENRLERAPMIEAFRRQPREILLTALARMAEQTPFYIFTAFVFSYGTTVLHQTRDFLLIAVLVASVLSFFSIPIFGHLSDRIGRKRMYMIGAAAVGVFGFVYFALLDTMAPGLIFLAIVLSLIPHDMQYGPQAAMIAECFTPGCATAAPRWATNSPRSSPADRRHWSRPRCSLPIIPAMRSRFISSYPRLRRDQPHFDGASARLHQPRRIARIRGRLKEGL
jgi:MFS family permease